MGIIRKETLWLQSEEKRVSDHKSDLFSDILTSYLKLFRQDSPPLHQDWIPLTVATRKVDEFAVVLIKLNKLDIQDLTWETKLLAANQRIIVLIAGSGRIIKQMWFVDLWAVHTIVIDNTVILWFKGLQETQYSTVHDYSRLLYLTN